MFFSRQIILDKEYSVKTDYLDTKEIINYKLLDVILRDVLLSYEILSEERLDGVFLKEMKKISKDDFGVEFFYENWNLDKTKYTVLVEVKFYKSRLKYISRKIDLKIKNENLLQELSQKDIKRWDFLSSLKKSFIKNIIDLLEIRGVGDIFRPWQSRSKKKIEKYSKLADKYYLKRDTQNSLKYINKWLRYDRKNGEAYKLRGLIKEKIGDFLGAKEDYDISMTFGLHEDKYLRYYRGKVNKELGILHEARDDYKSLANYLEKVILPMSHIDIYLNNIRS